MVRPKHCRRIRFKGDFHYFKPQAIPLRELGEVILTVDEFEAIRLKDKLDLDQLESAKKMDISQPTFHRILESARKKIANAIVDGKAIKIHGGEYKMPGGDGTGPEGKGPIAGKRNRQGAGRGGRGRNNGPNAGGPGGVCKCPECGHEQAHIRGQPCSQVKCPECNTLMTRK